LPRVSIISIALLESDFIPLLQLLKKQSFQDFEFIGETGGSIPEAWNRALKRAAGEIIVFTETDARPIYENWLEELVNNIKDEKTIVKGLEVTSTPLDLSNLAAYQKTFVDNKFDDKYRWAEDTELFCRLKQQGFQFVQLDQAPVIHLQKFVNKKMIRRAFLYGIYYARIRSQYSERVDVAGFKELVKALIKSILNLSGFLTGSIIYLPNRIKRKLLK
jgi:hypothetical protein